MLESPSSAPVITVIIPVWNGAERIGTTLQALQCQSADESLFEVIVVDNGSTDDTAKIVAGFPAVRLLSEPEPGSYRARNRAIRVAKGEWLLFTDGDCVPAPDWIAQAINASRCFADAAIIGGRIELFREAGSAEVAYQYEQLFAFNQAKNISEGRCVTANWLSPRQVIDNAGGFSEHLLSGGDFELSNKLHNAGAQIVYAPDLVVGHPSRASLADLISKRRRVLGGRFVLEDMRNVSTAYWIRQFFREAQNELYIIRRAAVNVKTKMGLVALTVALLFATQTEFLALLIGKGPHRS